MLHPWKLVLLLDERILTSHMQQKKMFQAQNFGSIAPIAHRILTVYLIYWKGIKVQTRDSRWPICIHLQKTEFDIEI